MNKINVLLFGRLADITGKASINFENVSDTNEVIQKLKHLHPEIAELKYLIAVDKEVVTENRKLQNNMTVALLPPFSGG
jgi:sulfur-carrier protein